METKSKPSGGKDLDDLLDNSHPLAHLYKIAGRKPFAEILGQKQDALSSPKGAWSMPGFLERIIDTLEH